MKRSRDSRERSPYSRKEARRSERNTYEDDRSSSQYKSSCIHSSSSRDLIREPIKDPIRDDCSSSGKRRRDESPEVRRDRKRSHSPSESSHSRRDHDRKDSDRRNDDRKDNDRKDDGRKDRKEKGRDRKDREKRSKDKERNKSKEKEDSPMDFDPAVDEEEMMRMMGFASFDSTKVG